MSHAHQAQDIFIIVEGQRKLWITYMVVEGKKKSKNMIVITNIDFQKYDCSTKKISH